LAFDIGFREGGASHHARGLHSGGRNWEARRGADQSDAGRWHQSWKRCKRRAAWRWSIAVTLIVELGDLSCFNPRRLTAYLGLEPCEHCSGASVRHGGITKAGNNTARRLRIEASWAYRFPARISNELLLWQERLPRLIREIAWKAHLCPTPPALSKPHSSFWEPSSGTGKH
jgi:hypothetical protein